MQKVLLFQQVKLLIEKLWVALSSLFQWRIRFCDIRSELEKGNLYEKKKQTVPLRVMALCVFLYSDFCLSTEHSMMLKQVLLSWLLSVRQHVIKISNFVPLLI